jgi:hypothetical protein
VFTVGVPPALAQEVLIRHHAILDAWEAIGPSDGLGAIAPVLRAVKERSGLRVYLSRLETSAQSLAPAAGTNVGGARGGTPFHHSVRHGFDPRSDAGVLRSCLSTAGSPVDGEVFRVGPGHPAALGIQAATETASDLGVRAVVHEQLQGSASSAGEMRDDTAIAGRVVAAAAGAYAAPGAVVLLDTFDDHDRGYFVRHGLVDRRYNPRPAYHALRRLCSVLGSAQDGLELVPVHRAGGSRSGQGFYALRRHDALFALLLLGAEPADELAVALSGLRGDSGTLRRVDLVTGETTAVRWRRARRVGREPRRTIVSGRLAGDNPSLLLVDKSGEAG